VATYDKADNLKMISEVVARMSQNDFLIRGWAVTVVTVLGAIAVGQRIAVILLLCVVPITLFWLLGSYYLHIERSFKQLFRVVAQSKIQRTYTLETKEYRTFPNYLACVFSLHQVAFYVALLAPILAIYIFVPLPAKP